MRQMGLVDEVSFESDTLNNATFDREVRLEWVSASMLTINRPKVTYKYISVHEIHK